MDVIYPYRERPGDFELRYSIRSLAYAEHGRVIVAGDRPALGVEHVPVRRALDRYKSSTANILAAAQRAETDQVIVMNDDIFLLAPWTFRHEHRGTIREFLASGKPKGRYRMRVQETRDLLRGHGIDEPLWFGLHTPTVYDRARLIELIREFRGRQYLLRTLYHNLHSQPSTQREDVKRWAWDGEPEGDIISVSDRCAATPAFQAWARARFPRPSPYERPLAA